MQQFDNKLDAVLYAEALLAGVSMKDAEIAQVTKKFRRETLEQMNILLADPKARAVVRLQLFAKGAAHSQEEREGVVFTNYKQGVCLRTYSSGIVPLSSKKKL